MAASRNTFTAVILAGGSSQRMNGVSKQQEKLLGKPAVVYSLEAFERTPACAEIVVVARKEELSLYEEYRKVYRITKLKKAVAGGETRQESAFNGMRAVADDIPYIAVHDAARCLVTPELITEVVRAAVRNKCASAAVKATDTVKVTGKNGKTLTEGQPDRSKLVYMQTPQIFCADLYKAAAYLAKRDGFTGTDDASLLERAGFGVKTILAKENNMKITSPIDLTIAEAILKSRQTKN